MEVYMNNDELMKEILKTLNFDGETFEQFTNVTDERSDEIIEIASKIKNVIYTIDNGKPQKIYSETIPQMKTPGELLYLMQSFGLRMGSIISHRR
jgi:hypothetical protein